MARSVSEEHVKWTGDARSLVSESKKAEDAVRKSSGGIYKSMNDAAKVLRGGEQVMWLATVGRALVNVTEKIKEMQLALKQGGTGWVDFSLGIMQAVPVIGDFSRAGESLNEIITGHNLLVYGADIQNAASAAYESIDKFHGLTKVLSDQEKTLLPIQKEFAEARAVLEDIQNKASMAGETGVVNQMAAALRQLNDIQNEVTEQYKQGIPQVQAYDLELRKQIDTVGMSADEIELYKLRLQGATDETLAGVIALQKEKEERLKVQKVIDDAKEARKQEAEAMKQYAEQVKEAIRTPEEKLSDEINKARKAMEQGLLTTEEYTKQIEKLKKEFADNDPLQKAAKQWIEETKTPLEKYTEQLAELQKLKDLGLLSGDVASRAIKKIQDEYNSAMPATEKRDPLATTAMRGSQEALANIFRYRNQDRLQTGQPVELQQLTETKKIVGYMSEIAEKVRKGELIEIY